MGKDFINSFVDESKDVVVCYRSGMTVYEEGMVDGKLVSLGYNTAGFTLNVLEDYPSYIKVKQLPRPEVFCLDVDGVTLRSGWQYLGTSEQPTPQGIRRTVTLSSNLAPVTVEVVTELDGTAVMTRYLTIKNDSTRAVAISNVTVMGGGLDSIEKWNEYQLDQDESKLYSLGYFERCHHLNEGQFRWHDVPTIRQTISSRYDRDRFRHPMFMLKNNAFGTIWFAQLAYSGAYAIDIDVNTDNPTYTAYSSFAFKMDGDNPTYIIKANESYTTPAVHVGCTHGDIDDIVNEMHAHTRKSVFTHYESENARGGLIEGGMGPERLMSVEASKHFIDTLALVGAETFIVDAGWYCPPGKATAEWWHRVGNWDYDKDLYPNGIEEIRDYAHQKGLLFGMWAEVERAGSMSEVYDVHPDWFITVDGDERTTVLDASNDEVIAFMENSISHLVDDYKIDLYRLDYNIGYQQINYFNYNGENGAARYYENLYAMFDRLRKKYPNVAFENCAAGGGRTDLGLVKHFTHTWVTDHNSMPRAAAITNGLTMVLPPEKVDRLASGMGSHQWGSIDAIIRHTLFGRPTTNDYNCVGSIMNDKQIEFVRHTYDIYKTVIRPFAPTGKIFHHTPEAYHRQTQGIMVLERTAEDKSAGVIGAFRLVGNNPDSVTVCAKGVDVSAYYDVTFDNARETVRLSGYELSCGVTVRLNGNISSELIVYKRA